ncbi:predicted protein [Pyrenophora tritici-repentis Pt-1C-BFP]|uniref:Uncharacterized protein n=1 Tax=Pyrenophora tritici-repentis (strain Pt-1C-BFP) TaxID=426418 RepID=B2VYB3_PYRTR|nr:uncharacterized protein PTRG_02403 [Pyrenophora tritici-repentis Pt-1C-BFP]EDU44926.1 predicted protein [Pyrenophora tritici-repentis Pt-1C-BFP]
MVQAAFSKFFGESSDSGVVALPEAGPICRPGLRPGSRVSLYGMFTASCGRYKPTANAAAAGRLSTAYGLFRSDAMTDPLLILLVHSLVPPLSLAVPSCP